MVSIEFPHVRELLRYGQFDTIYHEHFYILLRAWFEGSLGVYGLRVLDVERLPTHGGSLRVLACHGGSSREPAPGLALVREVSNWRRAWWTAPRTTASPFWPSGVGPSVMAFLTGAVAEGKVVVGYGAAAKGVTFLNYCGIGPELVRFVADVSPHKQGRLLHGHPHRGTAGVSTPAPDDALGAGVEPRRRDLCRDGACINDWGGAFVVAVPELQTIVRIDHQGGSS